MIMQLVFSLSEYDLKYELVDSKKEAAAGGTVSKRKNKTKVKETPAIYIQTTDEIKNIHDPSLQNRDSS